MKAKSLQFLMIAALLAGLAANALLFPAPVQAQPSTPLTNMPTANLPVLAIVPDGAGGVYIGGSFTQLTLAPVHGGGTVGRNRIAHILADGTVDPAWNPNADDQVQSLAVSGTTVYAGGVFTNIGGAARECFAAFGVQQPQQPVQQPGHGAGVAPEASTLLLMGSGLAGLGAYARLRWRGRKRKSRP